MYSDLLASVKIVWEIKILIDHKENTESNITVLSMYIVTNMKNIKQYMILNLKYLE